MESRKKLIMLAEKYKGNWSLIAEAIRMQEEPDEKESEEDCLTIYDAEYPAAFRRLRFPPWVIFYKGDLSLLETKMVSVVGSRNLCDYGRLATEWVTENLCDRFTIVSGMAKGADAVAHHTAVSLGGRSVGVIGSGLATQYPKENIPLYKRMGEDQLLISEYPADVGVRREHFPWRNRLIAALGNPLFVTQAAWRSGTMLTVNEAIALSKDIYCIPYPLGNSQGYGCNHLISQGAMLLYRIEQLNDLL